MDAEYRRAEERLRPEMNPTRSATPSTDGGREDLAMERQWLLAIAGAERGRGYHASAQVAVRIEALLARAAHPIAGAGEARKRIEAGMLELWREDADKIERWMGGAKSTFDRRTLDLVKAVRELTAEVERLYTHPATPVAVSVTDEMVRAYRQARTCPRSVELTDDDEAFFGHIATCKECIKLQLTAVLAAHTQPEVR